MSIPCALSSQIGPVVMNLIRIRTRRIQLKIIRLSIMVHQVGPIFSSHLSKTRKRKRYKNFIEK